MENLADLRGQIRESFARALRREVADANEPLRFENTTDFAEMIVTNRKERGALGRREFIGCAIAAAFFEKGERAIIHDEMIAEEFFRSAEALRE